MQSVVDGPANRGHVGHPYSLIENIAHSVHKLTDEITNRIGQYYWTLIESAYSRNHQLYDNEGIPLQIFFKKEFTFHVDAELTSSATKVMFDNNDHTRRQICLKMWLYCHNDLYQTEDLRKQTKYLLEGLAFNRRFSGDVYYGIVSVLADNLDKVKCGPLIANPTLEKLAFNKPYALVMKRLNEEWRLDHQLQADILGNGAGMEFLAYKVARMHEKLDRSLPEYGTPDRIAAKLEFNIAQFHRALSTRRANPRIIAASNFNETDMKWVESASKFLRQLSKAHQYEFKKRRREGHIKRCHGDLKAANLWVCSPDNGSQAEKRLVALDCVDFNPEFCNIDTLSDIAMLAIDLEMRLENRNEALSGQLLARHFLQTYLRTIGEPESVWPLLECYMMEKAMVCAYMSILYDELPSLGEKYLKVVVRHSQELAKYLPPHMSKRITKPLEPATVGAANRHG